MSSEICARCGENKSEHFLIFGKKGGVRGIQTAIYLCPYDQYLPLYEEKEKGENVIRTSPSGKYVVQFEVPETRNGERLECGCSKDLYYAVPDGTGGNYACTRGGTYALEDYANIHVVYDRTVRYGKNAYHKFENIRIIPVEDIPCKTMVK